MYKFIQKDVVGDNVVGESKVVEDSLIVEGDNLEDSVELDQSTALDNNILDNNKVDQYLEVDYSNCKEDILVNKESLTPPQPPTPSKKINFTNLLIYSRFK